MKKLFKAVATLALTLCIPMAALSAPADWPKELNFGLIPTESAEGITDRYDGLAKHIEKKLGIPVKMHVATDYAGMITAMQFKHEDVAYFGPKSYVEAAARANAEAFVMEVLEDGTMGYHGVIITKKDSGIKIWRRPKARSGPLPIPTQPAERWCRPSIFIK
jgi:phosphonate transport system substrate-binding protein